METEIELGDEVVIEKQIGAGGSHAGTPVRFHAIVRRIDGDFLIAECLGGGDREAVGVHRRSVVEVVESDKK